jgi:hypothetical protein
VRRRSTDKGADQGKRRHLPAPAAPPQLHVQRQLVRLPRPPSRSALAYSLSCQQTVSRTADTNTMCFSQRTTICAARWAQSASRTGSGTTTTIALVRAMESMSVRFRSRIELVLLGGKEQGLPEYKARAYEFEEQNANVALIVHPDTLAYLTDRVDYPLQSSRNSHSSVSRLHQEKLESLLRLCRPQ